MQILAILMTYFIKMICFLQDDFGEADYLLASQAAMAGCIVLSHITDSQHDKLINLCNYINNSLEMIKCHRTFHAENIIAVNWDNLSDSYFEKIVNAGYQTVSFEKAFSMDENGFESLFFMHIHMDKEILLSKINELFHDKEVGNVVRVKGFLMTDEAENKWIEINATNLGIHFNSKYSSCRLE